MKKLLLSIIPLVCCLSVIRAQVFEIRAVSKGSGVIGVEMRVTSGVLPTTNNYVTDLSFGLKWQSTYNVDLATSITTGYIIKKSGERDQKNGFHFQTFYAETTPFNIPSAWSLNNWIEIMNIGNSLTGAGTGIFSICESGFDLSTNPNIGIDLKDYSPVVNGSATGVLLAAIPPPVTTTTPNTITSGSASTGGNVTSDGAAIVTERGVVYSSSINPTTANAKVTDISGGTGSFVSVITGLSPATLYHVRAYAINSAGTGYGVDLTFTTLALLPTITTTGISTIATTSASSGGNVTSDGGATVTQRGVVYSTTINPTTANQGVASPPGGIGSFTSTITGLITGTIYHVRAFAINSAGTSYGADMSFTTLSTPPTLTTNTVTAVTANSATSGGNISTANGATVTQRGVVYSTVINPTVSDLKVVDASGGTGSFTSVMTTLSPSTTYHVRAYAINSSGTSYGINRAFTTLAGAPVAPGVTTTAPATITSNSAVTGGNIIANGGAAITGRGIVYGTGLNPSIGSAIQLSDGSTSTGSFISNIAGLSPSTTYHVRAYAINSVGTSYGADFILTTTAVAATVPIITTTAVGTITQTSAGSGGNVTSDGGSGVGERGIVYSIAVNPSITDTKVSDLSGGTGSFSSNLTNLNPSTTYHVRAYAINNVGPGYGADISFTTAIPPPIPPVLVTTSASAVTSSTASSGGSITSDGGAAATGRGIVYSTTLNPSIGSGTQLADASPSTGIFVSNITALNATTTYHVRAYATNSVGTSYGVDRSFTTLIGPPIAPTVTTTTPGSVTFNSATSGGNVTSDGGAPVTERGIVYSTGASPTISDIKIMDVSGGTGAFTLNITGLNRGITYHIRAYAINSAGIGYGADQSFTTRGLTPTVTTTNVSGITSNAASSGGNVTLDGGATITERGVVYGTGVNPTTFNTKVIDASPDIGSFTSNITNLLPGTTYHVRAYAINNEGTSYGADLSFTTHPSSITLSGKVFLQGAYNTATGIMDTKLNSLGILHDSAKSQPYKTAPFNYVGTERVGEDFFADHSDIVDWVLIELRDASSSSTVAATRAAFVKQDGTLVDIDGSTSQISFPGMERAKYYVAIHHRNHLSVRSATTVDFTSGMAAYDFTNALNKAYDGGGSPPNNAMATLNANVFGLWGGNANADLSTRKTGSATISDYALLYSAVAAVQAPGPTRVYQKEDFNMDGNVRKTGSATVSDYAKFLNIMAVFNIITRPVF